jgi:protocatechuate 3,4-dioxygenase beta subunit
VTIVAALLLLLFQGTGGSTVSGRVTDKESGAPLAGFVVTLVGEGKPGVDVVSDDNGQFVFENVAAGRYALAARPDEHRSTHLRQWFGETEPASPSGRARSYPINIAAPSRIVADLPLSRALAIEGRVTGGDEALANVSVRVTGPDGIDVLGRSIVTDDLGHYRYYGLRPGRYKVCANAREGTFRDAASDTPPMVLTCYPQALSPESAADVVVVDRDATSIDISMLRTTARAISGTVVDESGMPVENASVFAYPTASDLTGGTARTRGGTFSIRSLVPGTYSVIAFVGGSLRNEPEPGAERQEGYALADVTSVDATGITVQLRRPAQLRGRLVFAGAAAPRSASRITVQLNSVDISLGFMASALPSAVVNDDLTFALNNIFHAPMVVSMRELPEGWVLQAVRYGGRDVTLVPTDFASGAGALEIVVTNRVARPSARVTDGSGNALTDCIVLILPAEPARWRGGLRMAESDPPVNGIHKLGVLRPGDYLLAAISSADWFALLHDRNLARVESLGPLATAVTLREGDTTTIELTLVKLPYKK